MHCDCLRCSISTYSVEFYRKVMNSSVKPFSPGLFVVARPFITELVLLLDAGNLGVSCTRCSVLVNHMFPYICLFLDFSKFLVYHSSKQSQIILYICIVLAMCFFFTYS